MSKSVKTLITVSAIVVIALILSTLLSNQKQTMKRRPVANNQKPLKIMTVQNDDITISLSLGGRLYALDKADIFAEVSGILLQTPMRFKEGTHFDKEEPLIKIDDSVYKNNVLAQKSSLLNQLTLFLPDFAIDFPESASQWEQYLASFDISRSLLPLPEPANEQEKYYIASRNIYTQFYSIKSMEATLAKYSIRAPYNGVVTESNINPGTLVRIGQKLGEFTSIEAYEMEAFAGLHEYQHLSIGQKVRLTCEDVPGEFEGRIQRINEIIDESSQTVKIYISTRDPRLREGLYMTAHVKTNPIKNAVRIPRGALVGQDQFWMIKDSALALTRAWITGDEGNDLIVQGLADGMQIINEPPANVFVGMEVTTPNQFATPQPGKGGSEKMGAASNHSSGE